MSVDTITLSERLRAETKDEHDRVERSGFMTGLLNGQASLAEYARYLGQYARVYAAIESRAAQPADMPAVNDPGLRRGAAIDADLRALGAPDWRTTRALPSVGRYVDRIRAVADDPARHLAHHYLRYLGDLSGGQVIATMLTRWYQAKPEQLSFFRFDAIGALVHYKRAYRAQLDNLPLNSEQADAVVEETRLAFGLNAAVFAELAD